MASSTKTRQFIRLLDACEAPLWVIGPTGQLVYLSAGCADWLGLDVESLLERRSVAGSPVSNDPLDRLAASLSPPPGLADRGTASLRIQPPAIDQHRPAPMEVRFVRVGRQETALTIAVGGEFDDRVPDHELIDAVAVRQRLDAWRKHHAELATLATAGVSAAARRLRRRLQLAGSTRVDIGFFGPRGCGSESIAHRIHQLSAPGEPLVSIDGPLMDAELLDAALMPLVHQLTESADAKGTAIIRGLDEMPLDAQQRLAALLATFSGRLRLLALCGPRPNELSDMPEASSQNESLLLEEIEPKGIYHELLEILSALCIMINPLAKRVEDIPALATAMLDHRHAAGEGKAERLSRAALDALVVYPWPGDFQELDDAIGHAVRTATGPSIAVEHLPLAIRSYRPSEGAVQAKTITIALDDAVTRYELRLIKQALDAADGNRAEAARRLGISRARLIRKLDDASGKSETGSRGND